MERVTRHSVVFAVCALTMVSIFVHIVRTALLYGLVTKMRSIFRPVAEVISSWRAGAATDELEVRLKEKMQESKLLSYRRMCQGFCIAGSPFIVSIMINIATGQLSMLTQIQDAVYLLGFCILNLTLHFPCVVTLRTMDLIYITLGLCLAVYTAPFACKPDFTIETLILVNICLCLSSIVRRDLIVVTGVNMLVGASACSLIWVHGDFGSRQPRLAMFTQLFASIAITIISYSLELGVQVMIRMRLEAEATREALSAAFGLLRSCCDVVVELNAEGVIVSPGRDLGSFLLRGTGQRMQGCCLAELIVHEDERCNFLDKLDGPAQSSTGLAEVIHVHMKDGVGNTLKLELLSFRFNHSYNQPHYMVGLREFNDSDVCHQRHHQQAMMVPSMAQAADSFASEEGPNMVDSSSDSIDSFEEPSAVAILDSTQPSIPIRGCSPGFCMRVGRMAPGSPLIDLLGKHQDRFMTWLQLAVNAQGNGQQAPPDCRVTLRRPQGKFRVSCRVLAGQAREDEDDATEDAYSLEHVQVLFYSITHGNDSIGRQSAGSLRGTPVVHLTL